MGEEHLLVCALQQRFPVCYAKEGLPDVDVVERAFLVDPLVLDVVYCEEDVLGDKGRLDGRQVDAAECRFGILFGHWIRVSGC